MKEIVPQIRSWIDERSPFVLATVIRTWGSAPRKAGSHMAINASGAMMSSVSGGCVEGDVVKHAMQSLQTGTNQLLTYGVSDEQAWEVGLTCGGNVEVLLEPFFTEHQQDATQFWAAVCNIVDSNLGAVIAHDLVQVDVLPVVMNVDGNSQNSALARETLDQRVHRTTELQGRRVFLEIVPRKSTLLTIGAAHITVDLVHFAHQLGFESIVIDPRGFFTDGTNFKTPPDQLLTSWPEEVLPGMTLDPFTYAVTLSHQPQIDDQALQILLRSNVAYIGALGSRKTHGKRKGRLAEAGFTDEEINRIHAPVGVDIHASGAREIALSIIAQIVQVKNQNL